MRVNRRGQLPLEPSSWSLESATLFSLDDCAPRISCDKAKKAVQETATLALTAVTALTALLQVGTRIRSLVLGNDFRGITGASEDGMVFARPEEIAERPVWP